MAPNSRFTRYIDKISHCERRIENIKEWTNEIDAIEDERTRLATYKAMQEVVEGLMDLLAMILKDTKKQPKDDYTNIQLANEEKLISKTEQELLNEANGLRNRLVHGYNGLNDKLVYDALTRLLPDLKELLQKVKQWSIDFFES